MYQAFDIILIYLKHYFKSISTYHYCNIPNFGPNTYRHVPIDYDVDLIFYFDYWIEDPNAYEHDDLFYILGISQLLMIYIYMLVVLGMDPEAHD